MLRVSRMAVISTHSVLLRFRTVPLGKTFVLTLNIVLLSSVQCRLCTCSYCI